MHSTALVSGLLLIAMAAIVAVLAFTGTAMPSGGWQVALTARLEHYAANVRSWLDAVPGFVWLLTLVGALGGLAWKAMGQQGNDDGHTGGDDDDQSHGGGTSAPCDAVLAVADAGQPAGEFTPATRS